MGSVSGKIRLAFGVIPFSYMDSDNVDNVAILSLDLDIT